MPLPCGTVTPAFAFIPRDDTLMNPDEKACLFCGVTKQVKRQIHSFFNRLQCRMTGSGSL
jgi:hypothetical protein